MKPQQRKFIVEVKSARRRSTASQSSIWGGTDLKALVRAAETEAPHLFEPPQSPDVPSVQTEAEVLPNEGAMILPNEGAAIHATIPTADPSEPTEGVTGFEHASGFAPVLPLEEDHPKAIAPKTKPKRQARARQGRPIGSRTIVARLEATHDHLSVLEEENRRLKRLLAQRLRHENIQLRKMLERFLIN
ncbi:hypothetical protein N182_27820 [Sinorhizobium sp. GL2]|nr:hypothetical protein N182_27820 [Sinorhizobium sp. GL2]